jgi:hypothetical protein
MHPLVEKATTGLSPQDLFNLGTAIVVAGDDLSPTVEMVLTHLADGTLTVNDGCALIRAHASGATIKSTRTAGAESRADKKLAEMQRPHGT